MKCNSLVVQGVESYCIKHSISIFAKFPIVDDVNYIRLCGEVMIRANKHFFNLGITITSRYVETFEFDKTCFIV